MGRWETVGVGLHRARMLVGLLYINFFEDESRASIALRNNLTRSFKPPLRVYRLVLGILDRCCRVKSCDLDNSRVIV